VGIDEKINRAFFPASPLISIAFCAMVWGGAYDISGRNPRKGIGVLLMPPLASRRHAFGGPGHMV